MSDNLQTKAIPAVGSSDMVRPGLRVAYADGSAWLRWEDLDSKMEYGGIWEVKQTDGSILNVKCFKSTGIAWKTLQRIGWKHARKCLYRRLPNTKVSGASPTPHE